MHMLVTKLSSVYHALPIAQQKRQNASTITSSFQLYPQPILSPPSAISMSCTHTASVKPDDIRFAPPLSLQSIAKQTVHRSAMGEAATSASEQKQKVLDLLDSGHSNMSPQKGMDAALESLIATSDVLNPASATFRLGQGVWEVFNAPHIRTLSSVFFTKFDPIRYTLESSSLRSSVGYELPLNLGRGWLSASGSMSSKSDTVLQLHFDTFWVDRGGAPLRPSLESKQEERGWDKFITGIGRLAFLDDFATFPVLYVDEELTIFKFPPLGVKIAARRVS